MDKLLLTPREAAQLLGIGRSKLYQLIQSGTVQSVLIGRCRRIPVQALSNYVAALAGQCSS
jgi:excisionase family DNA binding protein